jgi:DNA repair exonuclease SbcCD ATPase subunit
MKIKKVSFKNFASYGNNLQTIEFDEERSFLYLVLGGNGFGKSTLANVIKFLCYGKIDGMNNGDLPNRINKNLWGSIELYTKGKEVKIERGLAPNHFKVYINGKEYDQAGKMNTQDYLENEIFEIPYNVFKNVIILSVNDFKSFLTMSPGDKKSIVDKIFGFAIINEMREDVKRQRRDLKSEIKSLEDELNTISESIVSIKNKIEALEKTAKEKNKEKIQDLKEKLVKLDSDKKEVQSAKEKIDARVKELDKKIQEKRKLYSDVNYEITTIDRSLKLYEKKQCPTCQSDLTSDFHQHTKTILEDNKNKKKTDLDEIQKDIDSNKKAQEEIQSKQHKVISKISSLETTIKSLKEELVGLAKSAEEGKFEEFNSLITEFNQKEREKTENRSIKNSEDYYLQMLESVLGDDGVKNLAMKMILPSLNNHISIMSRKMHIPFNIKFDDKFDSIISHLGEEVNPKTLSTGERKKADFVIVIALIRLLKLRYPTLNLLFLDEIFSSVDSEGVYHILEILNETIKEINLNTFVINHTVLPSELFDKKIEITKNSGFSDISIETIG